MARAKRYFVGAINSDKDHADYELARIQQRYIIEQNCTQQQLYSAERTQVRQNNL